MATKLDLHQQLCVVMVRHPQVEDLLWLTDLESRVAAHTYEGNLVVAGVHSGGQPFTVQQTRVLV